MFAKNPMVRISKHQVEKFTPAPVETAKKYSAIYEIGVECGFISPRVISTGVDRVVLERIKNIISLRELYIANKQNILENIVYKTGEILASLHTRLSSTEAVRWTPPTGFMRDVCRYSTQEIDYAQLPHSTLHGDYSFANVFVLANSVDTIVIIDPCPNFASTFEYWSLAPVYVDVGKMLACLEGQIPARYQHRRPAAPRVNELQGCFISGYEQVGNKLNTMVAHSFAFAVVSAQFRRRFGKFGLLHRTALYNSIRGNFPFSNKSKDVRSNWHE